MKKIFVFVLVLGLAASMVFAEGYKCFLNGKEVDKLTYYHSRNSNKGTEYIYNFLDEDELAQVWLENFNIWKTKEAPRHLVPVDYKVVSYSDLIDYQRFPEDYKAFQKSKKDSANVLSIIAADTVQSVTFIGDKVHILFLQND